MALVELPTEKALCLCSVASPKSVVFPVDAIVIYSKVLTFVPVVPNANIPLTLFEIQAVLYAVAERSPKSVALLALAKVKYSIMLVRAELL